MAAAFNSFSQFWPYYVGEHSRPATRLFHFTGTLTLFPIAVIGIFQDPYFLFLLPVSGYGFAWISHFFIERNHPATFKHPLWSLLGDFKMFGLMCTGRMSAEVQRCESINTGQLIRDISNDEEVDGM